MPGTARAQQELTVHDVNVAYDFGQQVTFQGRIDSPSSVLQASILFRQAGEEITRIETLAIEPDGLLHFKYNVSSNVLAPFSTIIFWFQAAMTDGSTQTSPTFNFRYEDNRFTWQQLSEGSLAVHWYGADPAFGQSALDAGRAGLAAISQLMPLHMEAPLDVYVYPNVNDLQQALYLGGRPWTGGHADPALGVAMVAVVPGETQVMQMQTRIPHEIAHVMLYREMGQSYNMLPVWLSEGLASLAELYPNPDYANALQQASQNGSLIPMAELCQAFPPDSGRAFLAYAQSQSFTSFLRDSYGSTGLSALVRAYGDGLDCELGASRGVGVPLSQLDSRWREAVLGQNAAGIAVRNLLPYLLVMALALIIPLSGMIRMTAEKRKYEHGAS
jgi:hypothetical protein